MLDVLFGLSVVLFVFVVAWSLYNLPIMAAGVRNLRRSRMRLGKKAKRKGELPFFSLVVPAKNEEKVIGRLLDALFKLDYPKDRFEVVIVEDGSTDGTLEVSKRFADAHSMNVKIVKRQVSNGKPSALNVGFAHVRGEIVGVFDADSVPATDVLLNVSGYFGDERVAAVQGRTLTINSEENMLTKFISREEAVWCEAYLGGKDALDLFVHLKGSCQFIRRDVLERVEWFDESTLAEDMEISAKLTEKGYKIRYAPDVRSWQESPADLKQLVKQRTRWFRGTLEVAFKYGRLMAKPTWLSFDAETTLFGPFILLASLFSYFTAAYVSFGPLSTNAGMQLMMQFATIVFTGLLVVCALALIYSSRPRRLRDVLWVPFIYFYWSSQTFIAFYAVLLILLRRPRKWLKTEKKGTVENSKFNLGCTVKR